MLEFQLEMKLFEFEGHNILKKAGIAVPNFVVAADASEVAQARKRLKFPMVAKVQVLSGRRGKAGGVKVVATEKALLSFAKEHFGQEFADEEVRFILLAEKAAIERELYISITYDTAKRVPFILFSEEGGVEVEEMVKTRPESVRRLEIDPLIGPKKKDLEKMFLGFDAREGSTLTDGLVEVSMRLWDAFWRFDCRLVEVNPLAQVKQRDSIASLQNDKHNYVALDAKVILDDSGLARHQDLEVLPKGAISAIPSDRELAAHQIDASDYRGSAGSVFLELSGDIAILASGGGASLLVMDALAAAGGKPANYTEYSGNPPREKVEKLTRVTLAKEGLAGCLVAGAVANFTDIYETLGGFIDGLRQIRPKPVYPIVIRRGGPRQKEAYEMLSQVAKKEGFDIHLFGPETPISVAAREMVKLASEFKIRNQKHEIRNKSKFSKF